MRQLWELVAGFLETLWDTGNWWARAVILLVVIGPLTGLGLALIGFNGLAAVATMASFVSLIILPFIWPLVAVAVIGVLGHQPRGREVFRWIALYIGGLFTYGFYLYWVPVSKDPVLVIPLILAVGAWSFLTLGGADGFFFKWLRRGLAVAVAVITVVFFLGGRGWIAQFGQAEAEVQQEASQPGSAIGQEEQFTVNADEEQMTVLVGPGTFHSVRATNGEGVSVEWLALSRLPDGNYREYLMRPGGSSWRGGEPEGLLRVKGVKDGTTLRFERVR